MPVCQCGCPDSCLNLSPAYWAERPWEFAAIADGKTEEERAILVLKWFIGTLKAQYTSRNDQMGSEKKPLNPTLGELFFGFWPDTDGYGRTELTVEQVSHHPPITGYAIENKSKNIRLVGHNAQKTSFLTGSIVVTQVGHATLTLDLPSGQKEQYIFTLPKLRIDGLWYGAPYLELMETSHIQSTTGWHCKLSYSGKGYFSGKSHTFQATLTPPPDHYGDPLIYEGQWDHSSKSKNGIPFTDVSKAKIPVHVKPMEEMGPLESRRLWSAVADAIRSGDFETASVEKSKIENEQRRLRREEAAAGTEWQLKYFEHKANDELYERLAQQCGATPAQQDCYVFKATA